VNRRDTNEVVELSAGLCNCSKVEGGEGGEDEDENVVWQISQHLHCLISISIWYPLLYYSITCIAILVSLFHREHPSHETRCPHSPRRRRYVLSLSLSSPHYSTHTQPTEGVGKSTIVTSLIKESFVPHVRVHTLPIPPPLLIPPGPAHRPRSHYSPRSHPRKRDYLYRRLRRLFFPRLSEPLVPAYNRPLQPDHRTVHTSNPKSEKHMSFVSFIPSTTLIPLTAYQPIGFPTSVN
jgi:hypothetical protein